ncbi:hypothetical protein H6G04_10970 [Calothrix membranacea FACHB-236]|nr:hypothetical protein [Calothrix membranacea FACHB-236]
MTSLLVLANSSLRFIGSDRSFGTEQKLTFIAHFLSQIQTNSVLVFE